LKNKKQGEIIMDYNVAKEKAVRYIGISKKTTAEVIKKLKSLGVDSLAISKIIKEITELEYLNDSEYVAAYIRQSQRMQKYSIYELEQKLLQKGIKGCIMEEKLQELQDSNYEELIVERLLETKLKDYDNMKAANYIYRRGFKKI